MRIWECSACERNRGTAPPIVSTRATPVSSQEDSMPRTIIRRFNCELVDSSRYKLRSSWLPEMEGGGLNSAYGDIRPHRPERRIALSSETRKPHGRRLRWES